VTPLEDIRLDHGPEGSPDKPTRLVGSTLAMALVLLGVLVGLGAWLVFRRAEPEPPATTAARTRAAEPPVRSTPPLGAKAEPADVPALDGSDPFVRNLLKGLSDRPELAAWLAGDGLIRNFVVSVENVANGNTPSRHLRRIAPVSPFEVNDVGGRMVVDSRSYERYNALADTLASLDPRRLAEIYTLLKPRLDESYAELGHRDQGFDAAVERAIVRLLETPVLPHEVEVREGRAVTYEYRQPDLEGLSPAQKQLLRMGPRNVRIVQQHVREIARALGIPDDRLPHGARPPSESS
jgi:hypothetical protein